MYENFETALRAATADYARIPNDYRLDTIRQYVGIKCAPGQKASRIINRLCLKVHLDRIEEEAEAGESDNRYMRTVRPYNALFARLPVLYGRFRQYDFLHGQRRVHTELTYSPAHHARNFLL